MSMYWGNVIACQTSASPPIRAQPCVAPKLLPVNVTGTSGVSVTGVTAEQSSFHGGKTNRTRGVQLVREMPPQVVHRSGSVLPPQLQSLQLRYMVRRAAPTK
jgi:hypothetical protein